MRTPTAVTAIVAAIGLTACQTTATYTPEYVKPVAVPAGEQIDGKALLLFDEAYAGYIFNEGATTFTGSGAKLSMPLGLMTREIGRSVYGAVFRDGVDVATVAPGTAAYRVTLEPRVSDFKYYYHQAENLGFAITPGAEMSLTLKIRDAAGNAVTERTYASGERKGGSYMMSASPEEKISRLSHEILADLMRQSLQDVRAWLAAHPAQ